MKALCIVACLVTLIAGELFVPLDGYNGVVVNDYLMLDEGGLSVTQGDPNDTFYTMPCIPVSPYALLFGKVALGAETGDPLLNSFTHEKRYDNRDHRSLMVGELRHPSLPLTAAVRYRYIDTYTDRFDGLWGTYADITGHEMTQTKRGVDYEGFAAVHWEGKVADVGCALNPYGRWHATPYFFSPLLEQGQRFNRLLHVATGKGITIASSHELIRSKWYYDHTDPESFTDNISDNRISYEVHRRVRLNVDFKYSTLVKPGVLFGAGGEYHDSLLHAGGTVTAHAGGEAGGNIFGMIKKASVACSVAVAREHLAQERGYTFLQNDTVVTWRSTTSRRNTLLINAQWEGSWLLPHGVETWCYYTSNPLREQIDFTGDTVVIKVGSDPNMAHAAIGVRGRAEYATTYVSVKLEPALVTPAGKGDGVAVAVSTMLDATCNVTTGGSNPLMLSINIHYNDAPELSYPVTARSGTTSIQTFCADENLSGTMSLRIPFIFPPLHRIMSSAAFVLTAGPLPLNGSTRPQLFPNGNRFGPEIVAGFEGTMW